jgi:transcriptional regulator with XRE-family HTH domain
MRRSPHAPEEVQLRAMLRDGRSKAGLTQAQVAKRLGKPQSFVAKYENGERRLDVLEFIRVLKAVGLLQPCTFDALSKLADSAETDEKSEG